MPLPTHFVDLVYTAALASYWHKPPFRRFLASCQVPQALLAIWAEDETKRDFLDKLLPELQKTETGCAAIQRMGRNLADQDSFPDLKRCEDYKIKLVAAQDAVADLKNYLDEKDQEKAAEREASNTRRRMAKLREDNIRSQQDLAKLNEQLTALAMRIGEQKAGYEFEDWFYDLMGFFEIHHKRPYKDPQGRQIDGSVTVEGTTYLVELRFKQEALGSPELDSIFVKVESKADNTMAICVAMSGFIDDAIDSASKPGTPLLLFDFRHLYLVLTGPLKFQDVVARVRRHCSQTGRAYLPANEVGT